MARAYRFAAPWLRFGPNVNIVCDGNSLMYGQGASYVGGVRQNAIVQASQLPPLAGTGTLIPSVAISGQTWAQMASAASDVDGAWVDGKTNVLLLWETTNAICSQYSNQTPAQCLNAIRNYVTARRAARPWIIACLTTIPREYGFAVNDQATRDAKNADMLTVDAALKANPGSYGLDRVIDARRAGSPFAFSSFTGADFDAAGNIWQEAAGQRVHLNDAGYAIVAAMIATDLRRLPRRPWQ